MLSMSAVAASQRNRVVFIAYTRFKQMAQRTCAAADRTGHAILPHLFESNGIKSLLYPILDHSVVHRAAILPQN